jgi:two-component system cell cycle response regulator DivK
MTKILVADDNPVSRELIREALEGDGCVVIEAIDGRDAIQKIMSEDPDLALVDIQMPGVDGFGVISAIRHDQSRLATPMVALTAFAMRGDRDRALAAGFDAYITKPINLSELRSQIKTLAK